MNKTKQVIVMRKDLNMRKGKMVAQGAHASLGAILKYQKMLIDPAQMFKAIELSWAINDWLNNSFTKICVYVEDEDELMAVYERAKQFGVLTVLIEDNGQTEFKGVKTATCVAVGPGYIEDIDNITKGLPLL